MSETKRTIFVVNAGSRTGADAFREAETLLSQAKVNLAFSGCFESFEEMQTVLRREVSPETLVIAGGGDGTLCEVANHVIRTGATLGVLPLGTGNSLARDLQIPVDIQKAIDIIVAGKTLGIDAGVINDRFFTNVATLGLTKEITDALSSELKRKLGKFAYVFALRKALKMLKPFLVEIKHDGKTIQLEAVQVVVGNGRYHGGPFLLSPSAQITSGHLRVYTVGPKARRELLRLFFKLLLGRQSELSSVRTFDSKTGSIQTQPSKDVVVDGEVLCQTPIEYQAKHSILKVRVHLDFTT